MKKLFPLLLILALISCKKESFSPGLTKEFSIQSVSNGATYDIKVAVPQDYSPETKKYAAIYVLDGEEIFSFVAEKCQKISTGYSTSNVLVVGIGYGNDRADDYTPTETDEGGGGAEKFMLFIKNELIPRIESDYSGDPSRNSRTILGHSFGGLCATYAFTNHNDVFGNYIMLSPSLWYDNEIMLRLEQEYRNLNTSNHQLVFLGLGELENEGRMLAPFQAFYLRLQNNYPDIIIKSHLEPHLDHRGSEKPNITDGLNFYFQNRQTLTNPS
jgi:predicted alpha/beta superfamily hydrolase